MAFIAQAVYSIKKTSHLVQNVTESFWCKISWCLDRLSELKLIAISGVDDKDGGSGGDCGDDDSEDDVISSPHH